MFDTHLHSKFSGDSDAEPPLIVQKSRELGLAGIYFTDHLDVDCKMEPELFNLNIPAYCLYVQEIIKQYSSDDFYIGLGLEYGLQRHLTEHLSEILSNYSFDYCIGSVHGIEGLDPYYDEFFEGYDIKARYRDYFEYVLENIKAFDCIDALGHLDYIIRYSNDYCFRNGIALEELSEDELIAEILKTLISKDIALEVNTGSFRSGLSEPNPSYSILETYLDLGGRLITIGSDAHRPDHVGLMFDEVKNRLLEIGFKSQFIYKNRTPVEIPL